MFWDRTATGKKITPWNTASGNGVTDGRDGSQTSKGSSTRLRLRRAGSGRCSARCGAGQSSRCGRRLCAMGPGRRGQRSPAAPLVPWKSGHAPPRGRRGRRSDGKGRGSTDARSCTRPAHPGVSHVSPPRVTTARACTRTRVTPGSAHLLFPSPQRTASSGPPPGLPS